MRANAFPEPSALLRLRLAAAQITNINWKYRARQVDKEHFQFLMTGRAASMLGHELCNCFQHGLNIDTALETLHRIKAEGDPMPHVNEVDGLLAQAKRRLDFALDIAKSFRDLSHADEVEAETDFPLSDVFEGRASALRFAQPELKQHNVEFLAFSAEDKSLMSHLIHGRKNALRSVFQNLFNNAAQQKGMRGILAGRIKVRLHLERHKTASDGDEHEGVYIDVMDTGPGLHWCHRLAIFEPGFTTRPYGSGIGLHIVEQEIQRMGGTVRVEQSVLGVGTWLRVWLPLTPSVTLAAALSSKETANA
jgi:signal transduction histidine kinase